MHHNSSACEGEIPAERSAARWLWAAGATVFLSSFLLFAVEPLVAKQILPWFGGSAEVWSTCLVFFQAALLAGYAYAQWLSRKRGGGRRILHPVLLALSLLLLPIGPGLRWLNPQTDHPAALIFTMLAATIGLPFVLLAATGPLLQDWVSRQGVRFPYVLFAVSNFASLAALLAYPLYIEPHLEMQRQRVWWSFGYFAFAVLCVGFFSVRRREKAPRAIHEAGGDDLRYGLWFGLSACGSMLLLSITNHITANVAAVPLLWVLPLATYLLTFVLCFRSRSLYHRGLWLRFVALALGTLAYALFNIEAVQAIQVSVPVFLLGLFVCCMFCHGELNRSKPGVDNLTAFYLTLAAGGAAGGIAVGVLAPILFNGVYELPVTLAFTAALGLVVTWREGGLSIRLLWAAGVAAMLIVLGANVRAYGQDALTLRRSFYGVLRVTQSPHAGQRQIRTLLHGTIAHGSQFVLPPMRYRPTTYYGPDSGIGIVLRECFASPKRVGVVGLGVGTIAAYGEAGDTFRFYEINPQVTEIAESLFWYLRETRAHVDVAAGDGRLSLQREQRPLYDVLALDAFSGDAIPVHLLTEQAFALYKRRIQANGVLAVHVSNDFLDLAPQVGKLARTAGFQSVLVRNHTDEDTDVLSSDWMLVTNNAQVLENASVQAHAVPVADKPGLRIWTDDFNDLLQVLKVPGIRTQLR